MILAWQDPKTVFKSTKKVRQFRKETKFHLQMY